MKKNSKNLAALPETIVLKEVEQKEVKGGGIVVGVGALMGKVSWGMALIV